MLKHGSMTVLRSGAGLSGCTGAYGRRGLRSMAAPRSLGGVIRNSDEDREKNHTAMTAPHDIQMRHFRGGVPQQSLSPLIVGGGVAAVAYSGKIVLEAYDRRAARKAAEAAAAEEAAANGEKVEEKSGGFVNWLSFMLGKNFYEGGFEDEMTRREAALILGIRESAPREKVREAHRRLALLNHPDTGGSTFVASKINEAKDKLLGAN